MAARGEVKENHLKEDASWEPQSYIKGTISKKAQHCFKQTEKKEKTRMSLEGSVSIYSLTHVRHHPGECGDQRLLMKTPLWNAAIGGARRELLWFLTHFRWLAEFLHGASFHLLPHKPHQASKNNPRVSL